MCGEGATAAAASVARLGGRAGAPRARAPARAANALGVELLELIVFLPELFILAQALARDRGRGAVHYGRGATADAVAAGAAHALGDRACVLFLRRGGPVRP